MKVIDHMRLPRRARTTAFLVLGLFTWVACGALIAPQDWDTGRGPVVPHDSFPADCRLCHDGPGWHNIRADFRFDHAAETGTALDGAHAHAECLRCHNDRGPVAQFAERGCAGCHVDPHRTQLGTSCNDCHDERTWVPRGQIQKHASTRFPLVGSHAAVGCFACHPGAEVGNFEGLDTACASCHARDVSRATNPDHVTLGWTVDCQRCHVPIDWQRARFDHPASFPLSGGHAGQRCADCHGSSGSFTGLSTDCLSCHREEYEQTTDPNHTVAGFAFDCRQCHSLSTWAGGRFDHPASFTLSGGHAGRRCSACHGTSGNFGGLATDCVSCHRADYDRVTNPNHATAGFPLDCLQCHTTATWGGARFDHPASFPLNGGHGGRRCSDCHGTSGVYTGLSADCVACHRAEYEGTTDPNHLNAGFPTTCQTCHSTNRWEGATFNHRFPIRSGAHNGMACASCHTTPTNFTAFSCIDCHEHRQSSMDSKHREVRNYTWASPECYRCHPNGRH